MSLPDIGNILPVHSLYLEVFGDKIKYQPYNIEQEKAILTALESENTEDIIDNYIQILETCIKDNDVINWDLLSLVDFLNLVIHIRAKSAGEVLSLTRKECKNKECKKAYDFELDLENSIIYTNKEKRKEIVEINDDIAFELYPVRLNFLKHIDKIESELDLKIYTIAYSINKMFHKDKIYKDFEPAEITNKILTRLSSANIEKLFNAIQDMITIKMVIKSKCKFCKTEDEVELEDFLKFLK